VPAPDSDPGFAGVTNFKTFWDSILFLEIYPFFRSNQRDENEFLLYAYINQGFLNLYKFYIKNDARYEQILDAGHWLPRLRKSMARQPWILDLKGFLF
jgi:hypothetical protein